MGAPDSIWLYAKITRREMQATDAGFNPPPAPAALTMTYRGPLGPIEIDADPDWLRELLPDFSPRSRRGRRFGSF